jgi:RNA polymerase sigma-70 factor (ECF subfamily)
MQEPGEMSASDAKKRAEFELLVVEHHVQLRAFVRSLAVDPDWVDDIAQEAFLTAYRAWASFDSSRDFGKWLRGIAANIVRNELRKDARRQRILHTELVELMIEHQTKEEEPPEPLALKVVRRCLGKLPRESRELVRARYGDGHSAPELATRFGLSANTVRQRLARIRLQIRQCVESGAMGVTANG